MKNPVKSKSILYTWLATYSFFIIMPIIISLFMYFKLQGIVQYETNRANKFSLKQIQENMDGVISLVDTISTDIMFNYKIDSITSFKGPLTDSERYDMFELKQSIKNYRLANNVIDDFYIYFNNTDFVVDFNYAMDSDSFYSTTKGGTPQQYAKWKKSFEKYYPGEYTYYNNENELGLKGLIYRKSLPINYSNPPLATMVVKINISNFLSLVDGISSSTNGQIFILDENNKVISFNENLKLPQNFDFKNLKDSFGVTNSTINGEEVVISYAKSKYKNWKYVCVVPTRSYWNTLDYSKKLVISVLSFCFILSCLLAITMITRNYLPIKKLMKALNFEEDHISDKNNNEFNLIEEGISKLFKDKTDLDVALNEQKLILKPIVIEKLLKDNADMDVIQESLDSIGVKFKSNQFAGLVLFVDYDDYIDEETKQLSISSKMMQFIVSNVIEDLTKNNPCETFTLTDENLIFVLINFNEDDKDKNTKQLNTLCEKLFDFLKLYYKISLTIGISNVVSSIENINNIHKELMDIIEYRESIDIKGIIYHSQLQINYNKGYYYPLEKELQLINCTRAADFNTLDKLIEEIFNKNLEELHLSLYNLKLFLFNMIGTMLEVTEELSKLNQKDYSDLIKEIENLPYNKNINEVKIKVKSIFKTLCEDISQNSQFSNCDIKVKVLKYIEQNYTDENLTLTSMAELFGLHPSYLSKLFKSQAGESITDYLTKYRIEKSKAILLESKSTLEDVCKQVGYASVKTFIRAFSKIEGITPGKFRELNSKKP